MSFCPIPTWGHRPVSAAPPKTSAERSLPSSHLPPWPSRRLRARSSSPAPAPCLPTAEASGPTPSVVALAPKVWGRVRGVARRQAILNPKGTIYSAKRFIGRRFDEVKTEINAVSFDVVAGPDGDARFEIGGKQFAPEEISALVLRKLVEDASKFLGEKVTEAVIHVPPRCH